MPEERHFLAAIRKNLDDRLPRLVYADWLEEQGDPRGELVRIEEAVRVTPIYSDLYWKLKPRRRELLPFAPRPWLKNMGYNDGTVCRPVFADIPDGWKERWRLLREFVDRWYQIPMPDVGGPLRPHPPGNKAAVGTSLRFARSHSTQLHFAPLFSIHRLWANTCHNDTVRTFDRPRTRNWLSPR